jgi:hypothetical protein
MRIEDLLCDPRRREFAAVPEVDALAGPGALQEASLIAVGVDAVWSRAWLLLDCRGALHIESQRRTSSGLGFTAVREEPPGRVRGGQGRQAEIRCFVGPGELGP